MSITNPQEKFVHGPCLTYDAEHQFLEAQQEMLQQASDKELQGMIQQSASIRPSSMSTTSSRSSTRWAKSLSARRLR